MGTATDADHFRDGEGVWDYRESACARFMESNQGRSGNESTIFGSRCMADNRVGADTTNGGKKPTIMIVYSKKFIVK